MVWITVLFLAIVVVFFSPLSPWISNTEEEIASATLNPEASLEVTNNDLAGRNNNNVKDDVSALGSAADPNLRTDNDEDVVIGWLTMGIAAKFPAIRDRFLAIGSTKVRLYYHSFDEPCPLPDHGWCVFQANTTNAEGRNVLLRAALPNRKLKYFVFFDDDTELLCGEALQIAVNETSNNSMPANLPPDYHKHCWEAFTDKLLDPNEKYPFIKPAVMKFDAEDAFSVRYHSCQDENFKGFHRDYLWFFFPYSSYRHNESWYLNGRSFMYLAQKCLQFAWKVDGSWVAVNGMHRSYPKDKFKVNDDGLDPLTQDLLDFTYPELGPWNTSNFKCCHRHCTNSFTPPEIGRIDPLCTTTLKNRYQKWLDGTFEIDLV